MTGNGLQIVENGLKLQAVVFANTVDDKFFDISEWPRENNEPAKGPSKLITESPRLPTLLNC